MSKYRDHILDILTAVVIAAMICVFLLHSLDALFY